VAYAIMAQNWNTAYAYIGYDQSGICIVPYLDFVHDGLLALWKITVFLYPDGFGR
jgi:hypothetical protein